MNPFRTSCFVGALLSVSAAYSPVAPAGTVTLTYGPSSAPTTRTIPYTGGFAFQDTFSQSTSAGVWSNELWVLASPRLAAAKVFVSGNIASTAQVTINNPLQRLTLQPPPGANFAGGKFIVYTAVGPGDIRNQASVDLALSVRVFRGLAWEGTNSDHRTVTEQSGSEQVEFPVPVDLPTSLDSTLTATVDMTMVLKAAANIAPPVGAVQFSIADVDHEASAARLTGFRVLNAAGAQITGFTLKGGLVEVPERLPPPTGQARAIEYYNPSFAHFFVTAGADEIAKLDSGAIPGWQRTGESFNVFTTIDSGRAGVCRFFSASFAPKSSHFYAPRGLGCEAVLADPVWQYEGDVFFMPLPDADGNCPGGSIPVYRLYNNGMGGAPNHRFTTSDTTFAQMKNDGWLAEGRGVGIGMCSPN